MVRGLQRRWSPIPKRYRTQGRSDHASVGVEAANLMEEVGTDHVWVHANNRAASRCESS